jgi:hypothetical protein
MDRDCEARVTSAHELPGTDPHRSFGVKASTSSHATQREVSRRRPLTLTVHKERSAANSTLEFQ